MGEWPKPIPLANGIVPLKGTEGLVAIKNVLKNNFR